MQKLDEMRFIGFSRAYREMTEIGKNRDFTTDEVIAHLVQDIACLLKPGSDIKPVWKRSIMSSIEIWIKIRC
jgi:hypothetical protein